MRSNRGNHFMNRQYLIAIIIIGWFCIFTITGCIGNIGELSGLLSGQGGSTYYVAPDGDNQNPGTKDKPWATPGYGSRQLGPGDTLIVLGGRYLIGKQEGDQIKPPSGNPSSWITIKGESENRPILAGGENCPAIIDLSGKSNIQIDNLEMTNQDGSTVQSAIRVVGGVVQNLAFKNLFIHQIDGMGIIMADVYGVEIAQCTIQYCGKGALVSEIFKGEGWSRITIRDCHFDYSGYRPSGKKNQTDEYPDGIRIGPSVGPIDITNTGFEHNQGSALQSQAKINRIKQCLFANNTGNGISIGGEEGIIENTLIYGMGDGETTASDGAGIVIDGVTKENAIFKLINVTIHDNPERKGYPLIVERSANDKTVELIIKNSIVTGGYRPVSTGKNVHLQTDHSLIFSPNGIALRIGEKDYSAEQFENGDLGQGLISKDPLFVAPAWGKTGDYHLQKESPARDTGASTEVPPTDLDGKKRPQGEGFDLGAYEYGQDVKN